MTNKNIDIQILKIFPTAKKYKDEDEDIRYQIDDKTTLYLFNQSNNRFKLGIYLGVELKHFITDQFSYKKHEYIDFQFQNDSLIIDDKFPWSANLLGKVDLNSLEEIVLFLRKEWDDYNNLPKNK